MNDAPTAELVRELLNYDPESGIFTWRKSYAGHRQKGSVAGYAKKRYGAKTSYYVIGINGKQYPAHRLAWLITHGRWPRHHIDHINNNGHDNRLVNLREATPSQNNQNTGLQSNNTVGFKGVTKIKGSDKYQAQIQHNGKHKYLGRFDSPAEAGAAYAKEARRMFGRFANV